MEFLREALIPYLKSNGLTEVYEFGVYTGKSLIELSKIYSVRDTGIKKIYGFDSFIGMPADDTEKPWQEDWKEGGFSSEEYFGLSVDDCIYRIESNTRPYLPQGVSIDLIKGFFNLSLESNKEKFKPAHLIDIDCDTYASTYCVLDFMFANKLVKRGTLLWYDDWGGSPGWETSSNGESRAHKEIMNKYKVTAIPLVQFGNEYPHVVKGFQIYSI